MLRTTNVDDDVFAIAGGFGSGIEKGGQRAGSGRNILSCIIGYLIYSQVFPGISGISGIPKLLGMT